MSRVASRLSRLEQLSPAALVVIYCTDREEVEDTICAMIATGEIRPEDRGRCVWWMDVTEQTPGMRTHEEWVSILT